MILPAHTLQANVGHTISCELKNGICINGTLFKIDNWSNIVIKNAIITLISGKDQDVSYYNTAEMLIRGSSILTIQLNSASLNSTKKCTKKKAKPFVTKKAH